MKKYSIALRVFAFVYFICLLILINYFVNHVMAKQKKRVVPASRPPCMVQTGSITNLLWQPYVRLGQVTVTYNVTCSGGSSKTCQYAIVDTLSKWEENEYGEWDWVQVQNNCHNLELACGGSLTGGIITEWDLRQFGPGNYNFIVGLYHGPCDDGEIDMQEFEFQVPSN